MKPVSIVIGWLMVTNATGTHFNWPAIQTCAAKPIPAIPDQTDRLLSDEWEATNNEITFCRDVLAARHEGWSSASPDPDPIPPERMLRPDDLK